MTCPIFCIRAKDPSETRLDLVNHCGCGNAIPVRSSFNDLDHRYRYSTGDVGKVAVRLQHELTLSMDEVSEAIREQLLDWKFKRMPVSLCLGRNEGQSGGSWPVTDDTSFLMTAHDMTAANELDMTGKVEFAGHWDTKKFVWDQQKQIMVPRATGEVLAEESGHGPGWRFHGAGGNRNHPGTPESAISGQGPGKSGWSLSIGPTHHVVHETKFPFVNHPGSLRWTGAGRSTSTMAVHSLLMGTLVSNSHFAYSVWLKGKMPELLTIVSTADGSGDTVDLSGKTLDKWTRIDLDCYYTGEPDFEVSINITSVSGDFDFEVGPMSVSFETLGKGTFHPHWTTGPSSTSSSEGQIRSALTSQPENASYTIEFVIEEGLDLWGSRHFQMGIIGMALAQNIGMIYLAASDTPPGLSFKNANTRKFDLSAELLAPGYHVWTLVADKTNAKSLFYANGKLMQTLPGTILTQGTIDHIQLGKMGTMSSSGIYFLSFRLDGVVLSASDVADSYTSMNVNSNTVAQGTVDLARGRWYEVVSVPQTPLIQDGDAIWMGDIKLRQVEYVGGAVWYADEEGAI